MAVHSSLLDVAEASLYRHIPIPPTIASISDFDIRIQQSPDGPARPEVEVPKIHFTIDHDLDKLINSFLKCAKAKAPYVTSVYAGYMDFEYRGVSSLCLFSLPKMDFLSAVLRNPSGRFSNLTDLRLRLPEDHISTWEDPETGWSFDRLLCALLEYVDMLPFIVYQ